MNRRRLWAAGVVLVLLVVGAGVVLAGGAGYAEDNGDNGDNGDEDAGAKCSEATLDGTYLFAHDGVKIEGNEQLPFANAGYDVFDGNGKVETVSSGNANGEITRKEQSPARIRSRRIAQAPPTGRSICSSPQTAACSRSSRSNPSLM